MSIPYREVFSGLLIISYKVVDIDDVQFDSPHHQTCGINIADALREELFNQFVLTFLQALYTKGHTSQTRDLLFGITQC